MPETRPSLEIIAPTVDEAVARGAAELGVTSDRLLVEVLDEGGSGRIGLEARQARVRLTLLGGGAPRPMQAEPSDELPDDEEAEDMAPPDDTSGDLEIEAARETVHELVTLMGLTARVGARWGQPDEPDEPRPVLVDIRGDDLSLLIGRHGESLAALQYIARLIVGKQLGNYLPILVDVEGYRSRRERQLRQLARRMAEQAVERGRTMTLEPMPPGERRIIHLELRDHQRVFTESVGEGEHRKVTIVPRQSEDTGEEPPRGD
jgi:spoIIIJ-associated protein